MKNSELWFATWKRDLDFRFRFARKTHWLACYVKWKFYTDIHQSPQNTNERCLKWNLWVLVVGIILLLYGFHAQKAQMRAVFCAASVSFVSGIYGTIIYTHTKGLKCAMMYQLSRGYIMWSIATWMRILYIIRVSQQLMNAVSHTSNSNLNRIICLEH